MNNTLASQEDFLRAIIDTMPAFVFVVDHQVRVLHANRAASGLLGDQPELVLRPLAGDLLHCIHALGSGAGCGTADSCADCVIRESIDSVRKGMAITRRKWKLQLQQGCEQREIHLLVTGAPLLFNGRDLVLLTLEDITEWVELRGLLPICANCKSIRQDPAYWEQVETYLSQHSGLEFTHSICPECAKKLYPELY